MSILDDELAKDESLWRRWREEGVTESTMLAVDVFFYATNKTAAQEVADYLPRWGLTKVQISSARTFLVFKGWTITGVEETTWSLAKLQDRTRRYVRLAEILRVRYEGCGAMMPDNEPAA
ncbi:MAG: hypothetical protein U1F65_03085 [Verrucomicrobiota bacterium]